MNPKFRPALARAMAVEAMMVRRPKLTRHQSDGFLQMSEELDIEDCVRPERFDAIVEFRLIIEDMETALIALDAMGYSLHRDSEPDDGQGATGNAATVLPLR